MTFGCLLMLLAAQDAPTLLAPLVVPADQPYMDFDLWDVPRPSFNGLSLQLLGGHYVLINSGGARNGVRGDGSFGRLDFDYDYAAVRLGCVANPRCWDGRWWQGSTSVQFEYAYGHITRDFGSYFTGPSILGRYTFAPGRRRVHPYVQGGLGFVLNDAYRDMGQRLIGGNFEFLLQAQVGLQFLLSDRWSVDLEGSFQHISNANTQHRNVGVNDLGAQIGVTYRFGAGGD